MKCYLTGPITGMPQGNIPTFRKAAEILREQGYDIVSPIELDNPEAQAEYLADTEGKLPGTNIGGDTLGTVLGRDIKLILEEIDALIMLPGWIKSRGARLEVMCGLLYKKKFYEWFNKTERTKERSSEHIAKRLSHNLWQEYIR